MNQPDMGRCKTCTWRKQRGRSSVWWCENHDKLGETTLAKYGRDDGADDCLTYPYDEGGGLEAGDNFGCVHHRKATP